MKRKFFSVLLALVLVLSFSLVTAVPAAAAEAEYTLITGGVGVAEWSADEYLTGSYSLKLFAPAATGDYGKVVMPLDMEFEDFADFSVWVEGGTTAAQALPLHDIKAVVDDVAGVTLPASNKDTGEGVDLQNKIVVLASQPGQSEALSPTLMSDGIAGWEKYGTHDGADIDVGSGTDAYWSIFVYSAGYVYEACYDYYTWDEIHSVLDEKATVTEVRIELRYPQDPADVDSTVYVDDIVINDVTYAMEQPAEVWVATTGDDANPGTEASPFLTIQHAIDILADGIVNVAAGTYVEDLEIPETKTNLELAGATGAIIKGVDIGASFANFDIQIKASGVKIHGFTIQGPDPVSGKFSGGMVIGRPDVEIYNNAFEVTNAATQNDIGQALQTWDETMDLELLGMSSIDVDGLSIHNNTFTDYGAGTVGYEGIYINTDSDVGTGSISIADNVFTGDIFRAITVERSDATISGNSIITDLLPANTFTGININDYGAVAQDAVTVTGNTIKGSGTGKGFRDGIRLGRTGQTLTNISVTKNTVQMNTVGIKIWNSGAAGVVVNYNDISGNTDGVQNDDTGVELDAEYNWYGGVAGPDYSTNPYQTEAAAQSNDSVSDDVDFLPWMLHTELVSGWNIYSTPIAPGAASNTIAKALDLWTTDTGSYTIGWYFNGATQAWVQVLSTTPLQPMQAVYLNMSANATIDVVVSAEHTSPPQAVMSAGWNLVGPAALEPMHVDVALLSAKFGAGAPDLWGYSQVHSPALHQTLWTFQRDDNYVNEDFVPTEGYWVHMVNAGLLAGFTSTPIEP